MSGAPSFRACRSSARGFLRGGTSTLPVIDIDGTRIGDSTRIIEELERRWPDPALYPADAGEREKALEIEDFFDEHCGHELRRAMFDQFLRHPELMAEATGTDRRRGGSVMKLLSRSRTAPSGSSTTCQPESAAEAREKVVAAFDLIERERGPSGYLVGDSFTVADLTAAAILSPLVTPPEFPYHQVDPARAPEELRRWREPLEERPGVEVRARHVRAPPRHERRGGRGGRLGQARPGAGWCPARTTSHASPVFSSSQITPADTSICQRRSPWRAEVGKAWWLLCHDSPNENGASHARLREWSSVS